MTDAAPTPGARPRPLAAFIVVGVLAVVLSTLSAHALGQPLATGALGGLAWTLLAIPVATAINHRRDRLSHWPDTVAMLALANIAIVIGAGLLIDITFPSAEAYLAMNQSPAGPNHSRFYGIFNTAREWLLIPLALLLGWHLLRRRRLLLAAVAVLYVERVVTYLYFAPTVLRWQDTTPAETTPALLDEVRRWMTLDLGRSVVDWALLVVFILALLSPRTRPGLPPAGRPARRAVEEIGGHR
jgi:hypothetical protein